MAWSYTSAQAQQFYVLNQARASPLRTQRIYGRKLLSANTVGNGNATLHRRVPAGSGSPPAFAERNLLLIACGKRCVLSPRPFRCAPSASEAENERPVVAEGTEREEGTTHRSLDEQRACGGSKRLEEKERARSSVGRRRVRVTSICRPSTAPACPHAAEGEATQPRPETPSCRVVWRPRELEHGQLDSPDSTSRGTPVLHLYLPCYQVPDPAHETAEAEETSSENNTRLDTETHPPLDDATDMSQRGFTEQETVVQRQNASQDSIQSESNDRNEECNSDENETLEKNGLDVLAEDDGQPAITQDNTRRDVTEGEGKHGEKDELAEDKRQREVTQGDIIKGEQNKQHGIREDIRPNDCSGDVEQLDITKEHDQERRAAEPHSQQADGENDGWDDTVENIKGTSKLEPDAEMTALQSGSDHQEDTEGPQNKGPQASMEGSTVSAAVHHQQVLEKREKAPPRRLKSGRTSRPWSQSSETNSPRRIAHPAQVISFPSPFAHTHSSPLPHMLPSFYGTSFGYRLRTLHTPQPRRARAWTTRVSLDKRVVKARKELARGEEGEGNHRVSNVEARRITDPCPKIMSSEWGASPCKTKTTKTFVWGPWGPQETKSVCELRAHADRCDGALL